MTQDEWKALCGVVADAMKEYTRPFVTPLVHEPIGRPLRIGSGTYLQLKEGETVTPILLTCEHVIRFQPEQHQPLGNEHLVPLSGVLFADRQPMDAATVTMTDEGWADQKRDARGLPLRAFTAKHEPVADELLFFRGLAGENAYVGFGSFDRIMTGYCSQEKRETGDSEIFEIFWEPEHTQISPGTDTEVRQRLRLDSAEGFSGSLVWNTRFVELGCDINTWRPSSAVVTGLLRHWDTATRTLLAWRVEHLMEWLAHAHHV